MKAFTAYQPFAFAIVAGLKPHETRPRRTHIRGRVAVHAGMKEMDGALKHLTEAERDKVFAMLHQPPFIEHVLYRGGIVGTVEIVDCVPVEEVVNTLTERERLLGDYSPGRFAWVLKNPVMFDNPIPATGKQGWWNWDPPKTCDTCENQPYCDAFFSGRYATFGMKEPEVFKTMGCKLHLTRKKEDPA